MRYCIALVVPVLAAHGGQTNRLVLETRLPGAETVTALATDSSGNVYATGLARGAELPVVNAFRPINTGLHISASDDGGGSWTPLSNLPGIGYPWSLAVDATVPGRVYAGVAYDGIYQSLDRAITWAPLLTGPAFRELAGSADAGVIIVNARRPGTLYVGVRWAGILKSTDGGATWSLAMDGLPQFSPGRSSLTFLIADPFHPETLIAVLYGNRGFRSDDGAASWQPTDIASSSNVVREGEQPLMAFDAGQPDVVYSYVANGLWRSTDRGRTWRAVSLPEQNLNVVAVAGDPVKPGVLYVSTVGGLLKSLDNGVTWQSVFPRDATSSERLHIIAINPVNPSVVVAFGTIGGWRSAGGDGYDAPTALAVDASGNMYVAGTTNSLDFPVSSGAVQRSFGGGPWDAFVMKIDALGRVRWATYLGGSGDDQVRALAVDRAGDVVVTGRTYSADFPVTPGAAQQRLPASSFVTKFRGDVGELVYSTYLYLGSGIGTGIAVDADRNAYVLLGDALARLTPEGKVSQGVFLGGVNGIAVTVDEEGNVYVAGNTRSSNFSTTAGAYQRELHASCPYPTSWTAVWPVGTFYNYYADDFFVLKLDPSLQTVWSTLVGGNCLDTATSMVVAPDGSAYVGGISNSSPFPTAYPIVGGPAYREYKSVLVHLDASGSSLRFSSHLSAASGVALAVDPAGDVWAGGQQGYLAKFTASEAPQCRLPE